jgi:hypothetical protein
MVPRLSPQARRALVEISSYPRGATEDFLTLCGFKREMLAGLVLAGLATGTSTIKVERYSVTDDGRRALKERSLQCLT